MGGVVDSVWGRVVSQALHPHWAVVVAAMLVVLAVLFGMARSALSGTAAHEAILVGLLFGGPVTWWILNTAGLPPSSWGWFGGSLLWGALLVVGAWGGLIAVVVAGVAGWLSALFQWRFRFGRMSWEDLVILMTHRRYWGREDVRLRNVVWAVVNAGMVRPVTIGRWYRSGATLDQLVLALLAGVDDAALRAHLNGRVLLDWDAVAMLAAPRSPS